MKKIVTILLAIIMVVTLMPFMFVSAADEKSGNCGADGDNVQWTFDSSSGKLEITGTGAMKEYTNRPPWLKEKENIKTVKISEGVTTIGSEAFYKCHNLESVDIPDGIKSIGYHAFYECKTLTSIELPDTVETIGKYAFEECHSLKKINIPDGITEIGKKAFDDCESVTIYGSEGSYAEKYANEYNLPFKTSDNTVIIVIVVIVIILALGIVAFFVYKKKKQLVQK